MAELKVKLMAHTPNPDAIVAAAVSFLSFILAGFIQNPWIVLPIAIALMVGLIVFIRILNNYQQILQFLLVSVHYPVCDVLPSQYGGLLLI